jgi:hypothetical protein
MARELVDVTLRSWALRFLADPVKFIVTELFANATDETPGEDIWLLLSHEGGCLSIGVWTPAGRCRCRRRLTRTPSQVGALVWARRVKPLLGLLSVDDPDPAVREDAGLMLEIFSEVRTGGN